MFKILRTTVGVLAAAVVAATTVAVGTNVAAAATPSGQAEITVTCTEPDADGVAVCSVTSSRSFSGEEQIQFSANLPSGSSVAGTTGSTGASGLRPVWCGDPSATGTFCYSFSLTTDGQPVSTPSSSASAVGASDGGTQGGTQVVTADDQNAGNTGSTSIPGAAPCPSQPELTCVSQPSGPNVVTIQVTAPTEGTSAKVTINKDGETTAHDATGHHQSGQDAETTQTWQNEVDDTTDDDDVAVIWAANGTESIEEQVNKQRLEREIYEAGKPYVVCFEDITLTKTNPDGTTYEVTIPGGDCIVVTP